ncbi:MAG: hypothetical protein QOH61_1784 [Chloroflexota bacterium]|jgi:hypothetical protein|nr:hypothetical protein [Chloroflexota bacterium]
MRRGLLAVGLVLAVMGALASVPAFLGLALGHTALGSGDSEPGSVVPGGSPGAALERVDFESPDGYAMTLPGGWTSSSMEAIQEQLLMSVLHSSNAEVADLIDGVLGGTGADISMIGGDIRALSSTAVPPNVSVLTEAADGQTLDAASTRIGNLLRTMEGVSGTIHRTTTTLGGGLAYRLDWVLRPATAGTQGAAPPVSLQTYVATVGSRVAMVTFAATSAMLPGHQAVFDGIRDSFRVNEDPTGL